MSTVKPQDADFFAALDILLLQGRLVIDRPAGSSHPRFPSLVYPYDYGYIEGTVASDGGGIDVWRGTLPDDRITALICTVDLVKKDLELKLLVGCTVSEIDEIYSFHNSTDNMKGLLILR